MRKSVPFTEEGQISRDDSEHATQKRRAGQVIDEVVVCEKEPSSWDDFVPDTWQGNRGRALRPTPAANRFAQAASLAGGKQMVQGTGKSIVAKPQYQPPSFSDYADSARRMAAFISCVPIKSGHAMRINVTGNIDHNMRDEWRRMLEQMSQSGVKEFEFNFQEAPAMTMTGLGMLLLFKERNGGGTIKLTNCNQDVWQLLTWAGMGQYFEIQKDPRLS